LGFRPDPEKENVRRRQKKNKIKTTTTNLSLGVPDDGQRNLGTDIHYPRQTRVNEIRPDFVAVQRLREREGCLLDHGIGHVPRFGEDGAEADAWEDVHVVALARLVGAPLPLYRLIRTARCEDNLAFCPKKKNSVCV
jgi:hypothetical protein